MRLMPSVLATSVAGFLLPLTAVFSSAADLGENVLSQTTPTTAERAFYIRGDFGYADYRLGSFSQEDVIYNGGGFSSQEFEGAPYVSAGVGLRLTRWLRMDLTGEYRFSADVGAVDYLDMTLADPDGHFSSSTTYSGEHTAFVGLANVYVDLPKWHSITPYVGAGAGFARNRFSGFHTTSDGSFEDYATGHVNSEVTTGFAGGKASTSFAWALMAGAGIDLDHNTVLDIGYRYVVLGSDMALSTDIIDCHCGTIGSPITGSDLESHELRIGVRYELTRASYSPVPLK
jgi:opacity protein-like surface antigen